jgi:ubiquinone/menaquinone biosynthesis C-methylase UbiE
VTPCDCCGSGDWQPLFSENGIQLGKCPGCDLHSIEDIPEHDARMSEMEDGHYAGHLEILAAERQVRSERIQIDRFQHYVDIAKPLTPGGTWLDIGCGAGLLLSLAQRAGYTGEGIELNADRRAAAEKITGVTVHPAPLEDLDLPAASVDVISMINVFSHLTSPAATLAEIRRVLKPGGLLVMQTGEMLDGIHKSDMFNWNLGDHLYFLGDRTAARYAEKLGYEILVHQRTWLPEEQSSKEWLQLRGRSKLKNAIKATVLYTPGGQQLLRAVIMRRKADSKAYASVFALRPGGGT